MTAPDASVALAAIRAREQAATPGPWWGPGKPTPVDGWTLSVATVGEHHVGARPSLPSQVATEAADAEFIAHARTDVPRMAAALRKAETAHAALIADLRALRPVQHVCSDGVWLRYADVRDLADRHAPTTGETP